MKMLDQRGVEPLAMKIFAGLLLLVIGIGVGYGVYTLAGKGATQLLSYNVLIDGQASYSTLITRGSNKPLAVLVEKIGTYDKNVTLDATGEPTGVTVGFSPSSGVPTFGSTMTVSVDNTATVGSTTLTIRALGEDGTEKSATLSLTIA
jgi:aminopeptidase S